MRILVILLALASALPAAANERRFTYTYETLVLAPGQIEVEPWTTWRYGKTGFYSRFDERIELETGVTDWLQTALYLNASFIAEDEDGRRVQEAEFGGVSSEWKLKLLDPVADPVGLALYLEGTLAPVEAEIEVKVLLDKRFGDFITALNIVEETEWEWEEKDQLVTEAIVEIDAGFAYLFTNELGVGLELRNHNEYVFGEGFEHSVLFGGPVISWAGQGFWAALTVLPQIVALYGHPGMLQDIHDHERLETRLLVGVHL